MSTIKFTILHRYSSQHPKTIRIVTSKTECKGGGDICIFIADSPCCTEKPTRHCKAIICQLKRMQITKNEKRLTTGHYKYIENNNKKFETLPGLLHWDTETWREQTALDKWCPQTCWTPGGHSPLICKNKTKQKTVSVSTIKQSLYSVGGIRRLDWAQCTPVNTKQQAPGGARWSPHRVCPGSALTLSPPTPTRFSNNRLHALQTLSPTFSVCCFLR